MFFTLIRQRERNLVFLVLFKHLNLSYGKTIKKKETMEKVFINNFGDFVQAQRSSYYHLLTFGIAEELSTHLINPTLSKVRLFKKRLPYLIYLYPNELKIKGPIFPLEKCIKRDLTYAIKLYLPAQYSAMLSDSSFSKLQEKEDSNLNKERKKFPILNRDIFIGEIPLMREDGTFILNGCERVIISQIIRSPGIYFRKEYKPGKPNIYSATIISDKGIWTKFNYEEKKQTEEKQILKNKRKEKDSLKGDEKEFLEQIYMRLTKYKFKLSGDTSFLNEEESMIGLNDNSKLSIYEILSYYGLTREEILDSLKYPSLTKYHEIFPEREDPNEINIAIESHLNNGAFSLGKIGRYKINKKFGLKFPSNILSLTPSDLIQIVDGLIEMKYLDRQTDDIDDLKNKQVRSIGELLQNQIRAGLSRINPNSIKTSLFSKKGTTKSKYDSSIDPRTLTNSIREFFITSQLSQYSDQINLLSEIAHKRRVTVFGPNGLKQDHVSPLVRDIHSTQYARFCPVETPEGQTAGLVSSLALLARVHPLGSLETPYFFVKNGELLKTIKAIYLGPEQEGNSSFALHSLPLIKGKIDSNPYVFSKEKNFFSERKTSEINFLTASPLQILSLSACLIPFVEHNDANRALMGANMQRQAVPLLSQQKPRVGTGLEAAIPLDSDMVLKSYCEGSVIFASSYKIKVKDLGGQTLCYSLNKYRRSNQDTCINQRAVVWLGEKVFSGQILADATCTDEGELALGKNLTVAYMPWEGYNYEDAIVINERLVTQDHLTSLHIHQYETQLNYSLIGTEKLTKELNQTSQYLRRHLNDHGIVKIGSYVKERDILVGKLTPYIEQPSPETKLLQALYGVKETGYRDTSLRVPKGVQGRVIDVRMFSATLFTKEDTTFSAASEIIRIYIVQTRKVQVGDKLSGRHGNKGVISRILSQQDMPYLPDGRPVDLILNPLGVPSRMNVGQVFESLLGLASEKLGKRFYIVPFDEMYGEEASRILVNQKLKEAAKKTGLNWLYNSYSPGKIFISDGRTGEFFDNSILVGNSYILKLIHLVEEKIHARATGPYTMITEQPLAGKAHRGGQRFGEMEVWALEAYGAAHTLQELLTLKSDDIDGRNDLYAALVSQPYLDLPNPGLSEAFLALVRELHGLGLNFTFHKMSNVKGESNNEINIFNAIENRLKLRALLSRAKADRFARNVRLLKSPLDIREKYNQKNKQRSKKL
jgi:DNA-directed RNA polymerase subunit beta